MQVSVDGQQFNIRKFTTREYLRSQFSPDDQESNLVGLIALGLANEDGSRVYPAEGNQQITEAARTSILDLPIAVSVALAEEIATFNGLDRQAKK